MMWHVLQTSAWYPLTVSPWSVPLSVSRMVVNLNNKHKWMVNNNCMYYYLHISCKRYLKLSITIPGLSHFFFRSLPCSLPWRHWENKGLSCPECLFMMWLIIESHFASFKPPSSSSVDAAHQNMWLTTLFFHFDTTAQSFYFARLAIFLPIP